NFLPYPAPPHLSERPLIQLFISAASLTSQTNLGNLYQRRRPRVNAGVTPLPYEPLPYCTILCRLSHTDQSRHPERLCPQTGHSDSEPAAAYPAPAPPDTWRRAGQST